MKKTAFLIFFLFAILPLPALESQANSKADFRPPSVPLITHDPYFSIWSPADRLTDMETVHWTGAENPLHSLIRVDGRTYRIMGSHPSNIEPMKQLSLKVLPTSTVYEFGNTNVKLTLTFTSPLLVKDIEILARPVTYITWAVTSADGMDHEVQIYFDCGSELAVNTQDQSVTWEQTNTEGLKTEKIGSKDQKYLNKPGDNVRIDWGYAYLSVPENQKPSLSIARRNTLFDSFSKTGKLPEQEVFSAPVRVNEGHISMASSWDLGKSRMNSTSVWAMVAYDDIYSIRYFDGDLKGWWQHKGMSFEKLLVTSAAEYETLMKRCHSFDKDLSRDLVKAGGEKYSQMCALAYRQCIAAHKLVSDKQGNPLFFPKENFSNGCIATVDVIYPFSPFTLLFSSELTKAMLKPVLEYSSSSRWKFPFAPHDLGTYPYSTGQIYGGGENDEADQMPVEETGNMIIILAALAKAEGNASFAKQYWSLVEKWAGYLMSKGFDPENQLCTDDFAGHLAHNVNLSAKAIIALRSYALLCEMNGEKAKGAGVLEKTRKMASDWIKLASEGDHTLLAYDQKGTWSQKYNLVWDKLLDFNLFPPELFRKEISYYKKVQAEYGMPLDNRERYSKNDWITWSATMADNLEDFQAIFDPVYHYAESTPNRVPLSDWYIVDNARQTGFQARSVVGGFYIKMLEDKTLWKKWFAPAEK